MDYKGYNAQITYDDCDSIYTGRLVGIHDVVTFHAHTVEKLQTAFREAVDDYLAACAELGQQPNR